MIKAENISYTYMQGGPFEKKALDNINIDIKEGEFLGLIGHTGSGKSTLIQILSGLLKPTEGKVFINGEPLFEKGTDMRKLRFNTGLVMQYPEYQLFEDTVFKDIAFGPLNMGLGEKEVKERTLYAADLVGIEKDLLEKSPFDLSGGQKRRVSIAGGVAMNPKILILDEPAAGLDPAGREEILYKIKDLHNRMNNTVILISHSMEDVAKLAERIVVLKSGRIISDGAACDVFKNKKMIFEAGLSLPQITEICNRLKEMGMPLSDGIFTVEHAAAEIANCFCANENKKKFETKA